MYISTCIAYIYIYVYHILFTPLNEWINKVNSIYVCFNGWLSQYMTHKGKSVHPLGM